MAIESAGSLQSVVQQLQSTATQAQGTSFGLNNDQGSDNNVSFAGMLKSSIDRIDGMKQAANAKAEAFERGDPGIGINDVMIDMQKSSVSFEMGVQVRNRLMSAYKEIMSMQV
ncbi:flagellar hook-basal body complex protein FliE [Larsenimonas suaedae]|uniref:Flagellar hook-basal body complex protein FliE n=1 Tax=Larsenimonas suaedae TaxID=1851019 RepID=A0ABU1GT05_9GAMM|nr:flagellar hook-basal body complex protein FliE [Larsenimonas suaedae]MCM2971603.1 flagellar hook-basal body complex protein FliE [Larsenimonas suaedae]MDR5895155.1 flagellar hook-basal body complex protein FliE [Larsenimonas suaedae]